MIAKLTEAWRFIFNHHPNGDGIMHKIMDPDFRITEGQFRIWFHEAERARL
jgi:hypothetical protein